MLSYKYLQGIYFERMDGLPGIYLITHGKDRTTFRLVCSYFDGKHQKFQMRRKLKSMGREEGFEHLELHHIIEPVHFASIDFPGQFERWVKYELPCVFLPRDEHRQYNHLLKIPPQDEKFRDLPSAKWIETSKETALKVQEISNQEQLLERLKEIQSLYHATYEKDQYLQKIVRNVLEEIRRYIPKF